MKIAHISDLHFSTFFKQNSLADIEYLLQYILGQKIDHITITGDLTDNADPEDFLILRDLFKKLNILDSNKLSIVIGNHDIFGGVQKAEDIFKFPEKCARLDYQTKVKEFVECFSESFENCASISNLSYFPFLKILDNVQLLGINSIAEYSKIKNPFASNGEIKTEKLIEVAELLDRFNFPDSKRIILVHHHFNKIKTDTEKKHPGVWQNIEKQTMKLRKKKRILNLFQSKNIDLVLHGHYHESDEYFRRRIRFLNAGGSIINSKNDVLQANFIKIKGNEISTEIHQLKANTSQIINTKKSKEKRLNHELILN